MEPKLISYALIGLIVGIVLFIYGFIWLKQKRLIEDTPTSKIRSIAMGLVEIFGEVIAWQKTMKGPLSQKDCVYYKYSVEEYRRQGKNSRWVTISANSESAPFYLKDDTGKVLVEPKQAKINVEPSLSFESGMGRDPPKTIIDFLKSRKLSFEGFLGINKKMRYTEWNICPKDKLYIMGSADDNPYVEETTGQKNEEDIMIQKGKNNPFYLISDKPEKEILGSLRWKVTGGLVFGPIITVVCLAIILSQLGML
jgi:hypothetical protein